MVNGNLRKWERMEVVVGVEGELGDQSAVVSARSAFSEA
jgi:hypothetical protein